MSPTTVGVFLEETDAGPDTKDPGTVGKFKVPIGTEGLGLGRAGEAFESADEITYLPGAVPIEAPEESEGEVGNLAMSMPAMSNESMWCLEDDDIFNYDLTYTIEQFQVVLTATTMREQERQECIRALQEIKASGFDLCELLSEE